MKKNLLLNNSKINSFSTVESSKLSESSFNDKLVSEKLRYNSSISLTTER
jgi:hypothetical protein